MQYVKSWHEKMRIIWVNLPVKLFTIREGTDVVDLNFVSFLREVDSISRRDCLNFHI